MPPPSGGVKIRKFFSRQSAANLIGAAEVTSRLLTAKSARLCSCLDVHPASEGDLTVVDSPESIWRAFQTFGVWLGFVGAWAVLVSWIRRDAAWVFGVDEWWSLAAVCVGGSNLVLAGRYGLRSTWIFGLSLVFILGWYLLRRERTARPEDRLMDSIRRSNTTRKLLDSPLFARLTSRRVESVVTRELIGPEVVLLSGEGRPVDFKRAQFDHETSRVLQQLKDVFGKAALSGATDLHFVPKGGEETEIRQRIDGVLEHLATLWAADARAAVSAVKVLADMNIAERRRPQDGNFSALVDGRRFDIRAATGPTNYGEKLALRLLDSTGELVLQGFQKLGMSFSVEKQVARIIQQPDGMLIVSGPTGSGKTTTLYAALGQLDHQSRNIVTIEDPIEYQLAGISQTAINNAADLTFANILRSLLRQDPDVILVGEIRDRETADIAMRAALTGHFVFTTLHANDSPTTITRLLDLGIERTLIQSAVSAVLAQRLLRVLCDRCRRLQSIDKKAAARLGISNIESVSVFREEGCDYCRGTGFRGRTGIYELIEFNDTIRGLLDKRPSIQIIRKTAAAQGTRSLRQAAVQKVLGGVTSLAEAARSTTFSSDKAVSRS